MSRTYLVTGVTGFLGKVVLSELLRRRSELNLQKVFVLVRSRRHQSGSSRFWSQIAASLCFEREEQTLRELVEVIDGELTRQGCGITEAQRQRVLNQTTHIIHCAASVDFDRPLEEAATSNITSARQVLELAKACHKSVHMVATSTAYVHPHRSGLLPERLVELPRKAKEIYADILRGVDEKQLLGETRHANTYTYTKCIAEHLLCDEHGDVPLSIVRPSIISASIARPFAGWIDSRAAFAGFVCTIGSGVLRVIDGLPSARLDLVPVDVVASTLIDTSLAVPSCDEVPIVHAVAGLERCAKVGPTCQQIVRYFQRHPVGQRPKSVHLKPRDYAFNTRLALRHELPLGAYTASRALMRDTKGQRRARRIAETLRTINRVFPYFTHHTFAFEQKSPSKEMASFRPEDYVDLVCKGARSHLMQRAQRTASLHAHDSKPTAHTPLPLAVLSSGVRKLFGQVTYDELALQKVSEELPKDCDIVLAANHPSRIDGLLLAALVHARPDLNWLPTTEVSREAFVAAAAHAELPLSKRLKHWAEERLLFARAGNTKSTIMFLEQQGKNSRRIGALDAQALRLLARERRAKVIVPLTLSYERLPEEVLLLRGQAQSEPSALNASRLLRWALRIARGEVRLGQVHISAGEPIVLKATSEPLAVAEHVRTSWQRHQVTFRPALRAFLARNPKVGLDVAALEDLLSARGVRVLSGATSTANERGLIQPALELSWRHSWMQAFWPELIARFPSCAALEHAAGGRADDVQAVLPEGVSAMMHDALLTTLARAISADYIAAVQGIGRLLGENESMAASELRRKLTSEVHVADVAWLDAALELAEERGLIECKPDGTVVRRGSRMMLRELLSSLALGHDSWQGAAFAEPMAQRPSKAPKARRARPKRPLETPHQPDFAK